jgi:hypothetical protein
MGKRAAGVLWLQLRSPGSTSVYWRDSGGHVYPCHRFAYFHQHLDEPSLTVPPTLLDYLFSVCLGIRIPIRFNLLGIT